MPQSMGASIGIDSDTHAHAPSGLFLSQLCATGTGSSMVTTRSNPVIAMTLSMLADGARTVSTGGSMEGVEVAARR